MGKLKDSLEKAGYNSDLAVVVCTERMQFIKSEVERCIMAIARKQAELFDITPLSKQDNRCEKLTGEYFANWEIKKEEAIIQLTERVEILRSMINDDTV